MQFLTAFVLGLLTILDPCTLFTSITAIGYIDKEVSNKRKVLTSGLMFVLGKLCTYIALGIPFLLGTQTDGIQHIIERYGEPVLAVFMLLCGVILLLSGHHHEHKHGISGWIEKADSKHSGLWAFVLGVVFAVAFCPHRLIYFITMIDMAIAMPLSVSWIMLVLFGLGTGLPIMLIAWAISYSAVGIGNLTHKLGVFEKWFRYICAGLFIALSVYLGIHAYSEHSSMHEPMHNDECIMRDSMHNDECIMHN